MKTEKKTKEMKGTVFSVCKTKEEEFWLSKSSFAHDIHISWLYYDDIKIRETFVYKHILML